MPCAPELPPTSLASALVEPAPADLCERIQSWAARAAGRLRALGLSVSPGAVVVVGSRRELFFREVLESGGNREEGKGLADRDAEAGASLALSIAPTEIEVALRVPPGALDGLRSHLATPERSLALTTALESLPEQFTLGLAGRGAPAEPGTRSARIPATSAATDAIRALLDAAPKEQASVWLGWVVPRDLAIAHADLLDEQLEDALVALGCVFTMVASRPLAGSKPVRQRDAAGDRRDRAKADDDRGGGTKRRAARGRDRDRDRERRHESHPPVECGADREATGGAAKAIDERAIAHDPPRRRPARARVGVRGPIEKGARVRVLDGPFAGKAGIVQEVDGRGSARVMLGLLAVRLDLNDLARCVEGRDRPVLASSHRKPLPARS